ncbi:MAG: hypothetical protein F6J98_06045 [Moorea sp. SIO4G2]|nr:hypothetical protein [Moorena sp. SIO4G2]
MPRLPASGINQAHFYFLRIVSIQLKAFGHATRTAVSRQLILFKSTISSLSYGHKLFA